MAKMSAPIVIVGGGLSGLYAARLLVSAGADFILLEARERLGGRILSVADGGFDLGPAWFWPDMQPMMACLVETLGLTAFAQYSDGDVLVERSLHEPVQRFAGFGQMASSFRIAGGVGALVAALAAGLPKAAIRLGIRVTQAKLQDDGVVLHTRDAGGRETSLVAGQVLFALPPRLLEHGIAFAPAPHTRALWRATPTWMAPHAKFLAVYDRPFWRERGLSGTAQSAVGPMVEIHDASAPTGKAALFGFVGVPAIARQQIGDDALKAHCLAQLGRLFGLEAGKPVLTFLKDWATDALAATVDDQASGEHPVAASQPWFDAAWNDRAFMAGSETAGDHPGYLEGALISAARAVQTIIGRNIIS